MASTAEPIVGEEENKKAVLPGTNQHTNGKETRSPQISKNLQNGVPPVPAAKKPSVLKRAWAKLGITPFVVMIMVKPAVAATISLAIYQSQKVAVHYLNLGYLIIVISVTTVPILPRGKFLLNLFLSLVSSSFSIQTLLFGS